ncbi:MAG: YbaB/EbfC family nucleoid-associated protein [Hamadaea sp.]|nr:YbaB/EbfC family nucleoid-associated protein [Hamadaea sp.]
MSDLSSIVGDIDRLMEAAQREAEKARDAQAQVGAAASGTALDGKVTVKLAADGRVSELVLDDEVMSMSAQQLAREISSAFNHAWAGARSQDPAAAAVAAIDPAALASRMQELREEGVRSMQRITESLGDVMQKIDRRLS